MPPPNTETVEPGDGSDGEGGTICDLYDNRTKKKSDLSKPLKSLFMMCLVPKAGLEIRTIKTICY